MAGFGGIGYTRRFLIIIKRGQGLSLCSSLLLSTYFLLFLIGPRLKVKCMDLEAFKPSFGEQGRRFDKTWVVI